MNTNVKRAEEKENIEILKESLNSPYVMEIDESFKLLDAKETRGKRRYLVSDTGVTEAFILGLEKEDMLLSRGNGTMMMNNKETSCLTITFKSNQEATIKDMFEELKAENEPSTMDIIMSLSRTYSKHEQRSKEWFNERDTRLTSTESLLGKSGMLTTNRYMKQAFQIAYSIGGDMQRKIISSIVSESEAHERGIEWENPMNRGVRQERYTIELIEEELQLETPTKANGINMLDGMNFGDSDDNSFTAEKDITLKNGQVIKKGMRVLLEIKNPSFYNFINPEYKNKSHIWVQNQHHLIVGGGNVVLFVKHFMGFSLDMELIYLNEEYARRFLREAVEFEEECVAINDKYVSDYYDNQDISF